MPQRRITVEEVLEAYRVTGMKPEVGHYFTLLGGYDCACAIGALAVSHGISKDSKDASDWADDNFGGDYHGGFTSGFDGLRITLVKSDNDRFTQGYADGTAVREAVFGKQGA